MISLQIGFRLSLLAAFVLFSVSALAVEVEIGLNFTGSTLHLNSDNTPPNANGASGLQHYVEIVNGRYSVYDKLTGGVIASSTDQTFWSGGGISFAPGVEVSDPRVLFDPLSQRWFASGLDLRRSTFEENRLLLGVSKTSNPLDGWNTLAFDPDPATGYFSDFPTLGIDANGVYLAANFFEVGATAVAGKTVVSIPKSDLLSVTPTVANRTGFGLVSASVGGLTIQPSVSFDPAAAHALLLGQGPLLVRQLRLTSIENADGPGPASLSATTNIPVPSYGPTGNLLQPDGTTTLKNIDNRFGAMVYEVNGVLNGVHVTQVNGRSAIRWYRIAALSGLLLESGTLSEPGVDYSFPSIAANENGVIMIGFNKSSASEFVSSYAVAGETVAGNTTFGIPILLKAGVADYHYFPVNGLSRWGDFSSINVDPTDSNVFWTNQEFVSAPDVWSTQITAIRIVPEASISTLLCSTMSIFMLGQGRRRACRKVCVERGTKGQRSMKKKNEKQGAINGEALDELIEGYGHTPEAILGEGGLLAQLTKALVERALGAELGHHLQSEREAGEGEIPSLEGGAGAGARNCRNGFSRKVVLGDSGKLELAVPRDRRGSFEPRLVPKWKKRLPGFDAKIIALYARGLTVREIQALLEEQYHVEVSADFISTVTDAVHAEVGEWQNRPLERMDPLVFFDALRVRIRDEGTVRNKAVYLALGVAADGTREVLGLWIEQNEGAKFWLKVMNELRNRGVEDVLIAVVDGLKGFPEAITAVFPEASVQTCIVHLIRQSLSYCGWKEYPVVAAALKLIYRAENAEVAAGRLSEFEAGEWGKKYPTIGASWRRAWEQVIPFFAYPAEVRQIISTTNAIESLNRQLRKILKTRGHFPSDEAATKLLYLALRNITAKWKAPPKGWSAATNQFAIQFGTRFSPPSAC